MASANDGGPAFPVEVQWDDDGSIRGLQTYPRGGWEMGMSLLDYFAGQVVNGLMMTDFGKGNPKHIAQLSYDIADEMLLMREFLLERRQSAIALARKGGEVQ